MSFLVSSSAASQMCSLMAAGFQSVRSPLWAILFLVETIALVNGADVSLGSVLRAFDRSKSWTSPSKSFSFGFTKSPRNPSLYLAGIVHSSSSTLIWKVGGVSPAGVDVGASLLFSLDGNLRLINGSGTVVWQTSTGNQNVSGATINDAGNFAIKNAKDSIVWDTFGHPADVLVQNMNFTFGQTLSSGLYSFTLANVTGNLSLRWNDTIEYWRLSNSTFAGNLTTPHLSLGEDGVLSLYDPSFPAPVRWIYSNDYSALAVSFRFLRLDSDGNLRAYSVDGDRNVIGVWSAVEDQCLVYGWCGHLGMCIYNDTRPLCVCPSQDFVLVDPGDPTQGCRRKQELSDCFGNSSMLQLRNTKFLVYPPENQDPNQNFFSPITPCKTNCLITPACIGSTSSGTGSGLCFKKLSGFLSAYQGSTVSDTSFLKVCGPGIPNPSWNLDGGSRSANCNSRSITLALGTIVGLIVASLLVLICLETLLWWCICKNSTKFGTISAKYSLLEYASGAPVQFSYKELQQATKGFRERLGSGGFGQVYRGTLPNRTIVAVKKLEGIEQGEKQFRMEVAAISSTHHLNLVRLFGFCSEGRHRLLVYEFMRNGSLDTFLFSDNVLRLDWDARFNVALGTAKGIAYLHEECRDCIVHCDIKPENILLDENYNAKVSDFGLAKLINHRDHRYRTLTSIHGTRGYLAPEWLANLPITSKSDVYSYGMVLLEIISGRRNFDVSEVTAWKKFSSWAYEELERGNVERIVDKRISQQVDMEELSRVLQVSFWCIQEQPALRPSMSKVVQMLEGILLIEGPPAPTAIGVPPSFSSNNASAEVC